MTTNTTTTTTSTPATTTASKYRGVKTGMRVQEFQNWQMAQQPTRQLSDLALLNEMAAEFPQATGKIFTADINTRLAILAGVRRLAVAGKHGRINPTAPPMPTTTAATRFGKLDPVPAAIPAPVAEPVTKTQAKRAAKLAKKIAAKR